MIGELRTLAKFYRRHLRVQPLRELMAVAGIAAGVALLFAVQVARVSTVGSFEAIERGVAGHATLELTARGPRGFDERIALQAQRMAGVKAAAPLLAQPIVAAGPRGQRALTLVGATEQVGSLQGALSQRFEQAGQSSSRGLLVLSEANARALGVRPGGEVTILSGARTKHLALDAVVPDGALGGLAQSPLAAAPLTVVQVLTGLPGRVTRVLIEPRPGQEAELRRALTSRFGASLDVRSVDSEARLLGNAAAPETQVTLLFSVIALVGGIVLAYNALLLAGDERRRFVTYLIKSDTPDSMIVASLAFDALILGVAGVVVGLIAGDLISLIAFRSVPGYIAAAFPVGGARVVDAQTILLSLGGGILAAFAAAALPSVRVLRAGAVAEPNAVGPTLSLAVRLAPSQAAVFAGGALLVCVSVAVAVLAPATTVVALVGFTAGMVICLPVILRVLLAGAQILIRHFGDPAARLALAELRSASARSVALLATGTVAAFLMLLIGGSVADVQHAVRRGAGDLLPSGQLWVKPSGPQDVYTTEPFAAAQTQRRLEAVSEISAVAPWRDAFLDLPNRRVWVVGVPRTLAAQILPSQLRQGSLALADRRLREGGWAAVSQPIAHEAHLRIGQRFTLPTPSGQATLRLAATVANYGWLPGAIVINADEQARLWGSSEATELAITPAPGVSIARGMRAVRAALGLGRGGRAGSQTALTVQSSGERRAEASAVLGSTLSRLDDTTFVVLIATAASVIALMLAAVWQRRGRLEKLTDIGMSFTQLARLVFYESGLPLLCGVAIGIAAGLLGQDLIDRWLAHGTGSPVQFSPAWQLGLRTAAIITAIALVASLVAVARSDTLEPTAALATE
jgi:putative ABC transport system permease protein